MKNDLEIARSIPLRPIGEVASAAGLLPDEVEPHGHHKAKVSLSALARLSGKRDGRYVVVWLTSLPAVSGGFRGEVADVVVKGE